MFRGAGGGGRRRLRLAEAPSGGILNARTGVYLAGDTRGVRDVVELTDDSCEGVARAEVRVVEPISLLPRRARVGRGQRFTFEVEGGSGQYAFSAGRLLSGGSVSAQGEYVSGDTLAEDTLVVTDALTGERVEATVEVSQSARLAVSPQLLWAPLDSRAELRVTGGSGVYELVVRPRLGVPEAPPSITLLPAAAVPGAQGPAAAQPFVATAPGLGDVWVRDRFLGVEVAARLEVVESLSYATTRAGKGQRETKMAKIPDIDGDGVADLVVGVGEADVGDTEAGAVYVYHSATRALAQQISTGERFAHFGRAVAAADWSGDGVADLLVGAFTADVGSGDNGALYLYRGVAGGAFEPTPTQVLAGARSGDQLGVSVAACDFNGDGLLDLAVGAWAAEVPRAGTDTQGVTALYMNTGDPQRPFFGAADQSLPGVTLVGGEWRGEGNQRAGSHLAAGDLDGDGHCDLVVSAALARGPNDRPDDGRVFIYKGLPASAESLGGVTPLPVVAIAPEEVDQNGRFGWHAVTGDLDGDGRHDLLVSQYRSNRGGEDRGSVYRFAWEALPSAPATSYISTLAARWERTSMSNFESFGSALDLGDWNGDGRLDVLVGSLLGELPRSSNTGLVYVFYGDGAGGVSEAADWAAQGLANNDNLGEGVALLGVGQLAAFAGLDDTLGLDVGRPYWLTRDAADPARAALAPLDMPGETGGGRFGISLALTPDLSGDGAPDLLVGASYVSAPTVQALRAGSAKLYTSLQSGAAPTLNLEGFQENSAFDFFGESARAIGDFDGDGRGDVAVGARTDEQPSAVPASFVADPSCPARANNAGVVYVFRGRPLPEGGVEAAPSFALYGALGNDELHVVAGEGDINGDGRADVVVGGPASDVGGSDSGAAAVFLGRPAIPGLTQVVCTPALRLNGAQQGARLGSAVEHLGDLNGDGCADFVIGEPNATAEGRARQGVAHVLFGWGRAGCFSQAQLLSVTVGGGDDRFGTSLAAAQLDGDRVPDLAVGSYNALTSGQRAGVVWVLRGQWLRALPTRSTSAPLTVHALTAAATDAAQGVWWLGGRAPLDRFGWRVAAAEGLLLVGAPFAAVGERPQAGTAALFTVGAGGVDPSPVGLFVGETWHFSGQLGDQVSLLKTPQGGWVAAGSP
ncbi:MAG: hypothetical protein FJ138_13335, partial [Deltaproteobacteria bacterium]|nr:hypothetical protein [Deltaproteobacteria bacterium]